MPEPTSGGAARPAGWWWRQRLRVGLVLGLTLGSGGAAQAGTLTSGLQNLVNDPAFANLRLPVIVRFKVGPTEEQTFTTEFQNAVTGAGTLAAKKAAGYNKARQQRDGLLASVPCGATQSVQQILTAGVTAGSAVNVYAGVMSRVVTLKAKPALINQLKAHPGTDVISLAGTANYVAPAVTPATTEWNITLVGAPAVCTSSTLSGQCGKGAVVGVIGTGANLAHQDLAPICQSPGHSEDGQTCLGLGKPEACEASGGYCVGAQINRATGAAYWQDVTATPQATPYDDDGSGTHLVGVAVGRNGVGVAPAATWMACRAFVPLGGGELTLDRGFGQINECIDYLINPDNAPTMLEQHAVHAADVILLPYPLSTPLPEGPTACQDGGDSELQRLQQLMVHLRGINITPVVAVGDGGGAGVPLPAAYRPAFAVGMTQDVEGAANAAQDASSPAGTTLCLDDGVSTAQRPSPALLAPGINVRAPGKVVGANVNAYEVRRGAAVAAAHVAGAVALLRGVNADIHLGREFGDNLHYAADEILVRSATNYQASTFRPGRLNLAEAFKDRAERLQDTVSYPTPFYTDAVLSGTAVFRNISPYTWTPAAGVTLAVVPGANVWGVSEVVLPAPPNPLVLPDPSTIRPGETATFNLTGTAPHVDGTYAHQYQLVRGGTAFPVSPASVPQTQARSIVVTGINGSVVSSVTITRQSDGAVLSALPRPGEAATVTIVVRNSGTKTWQQGTHRLGSQSPQDNTVWGTNRLSFVNNNPSPSCVATQVKQSCAVAGCVTFDPCSSAKFTITVPGPVCAGYLGKVFDWQMVEEGLAWFGPHATAAIPTYDAAELVSASVPSGWTLPGSSEAYSGRFKNCGTTTWNGNAYSIQAGVVVGGAPTATVYCNGIAPAQECSTSGSMPVPNVSGKFEARVNMLAPGFPFPAVLASKSSLPSMLSIAHIFTQDSTANWIPKWSTDASETQEGTWNGMTWDATQNRWEGSGNWVDPTGELRPDVGDWVSVTFVAPVSGTYQLQSAAVTDTGGTCGDGIFAYAWGGIPGFGIFYYYGAGPINNGGTHDLLPIGPDNHFWGAGAGTEVFRFITRPRTTNNCDAARFTFTLYGYE